MRLSPVVGLHLGTSVVRAESPIGAPTWGPSGLLRDLELRLGLPQLVEDPDARLADWTSRIESLADEDAFYAKSLAADVIGTASTLLEWRDALVDAGWSGQPVAGGGPRLEALAAIEGFRAERASLARADRLACVEAALLRGPPRIYEMIALVEGAVLWPRRWQNVFRLLRLAGTELVPFIVDLPGAPPETDLGRLQAHLRGEPVTAGVRGDGTLLVLRGDTSTELGAAMAALLERRGSLADDVVIRCADAEALEGALEKHGLPSQGCASASPWRPVMQVLPLAIEVAFEPRDPHRILELLTLSVGPFRGAFGARLARAVGRQPGIGGKEWRLQRAEAIARVRQRALDAALERGLSADEASAAADARVGERVTELVEWLERPGLSREDASKSDLVAVVERVRAWLQRRMRGGEVELYRGAWAQAQRFEEALLRTPQDRLTLEDVRKLVEHHAMTEESAETSPALAGRAPALVHPSGVLGPCERLYFWSLVGGIEPRVRRIPWNAVERAALAEAGVSFVDPTALLRADAETWRRSVLAAREAVVFAIPRSIRGVASVSHPFWDEVHARLALDGPTLARISRDARDLRRTPVAVLGLPEGRGAWRVDRDLLRTTREDRKTSVTALETVATCPLAWAFETRADFRSGAVARIAAGPLLYGMLAHRLIEELFIEGVFALEESAFVERAMGRFERLLAIEGATLLLPGASIERLQMTRQVQRAVRELHRYLRRSGFTVIGVEEEIATTSAVGELYGRLDLRLADAAGRLAILDLKWGGTTYKKLLESGRAVQLAIYSRALATAGWAPPAAYFAFSSAQVLAVDPRMKPARPTIGRSSEATWRAVETTAQLVMRRLEEGHLDVSAAKRSIPLLDVLGVSEAERELHYESPAATACNYCNFGPLCGRQWDALV